MTLVIDAGHGGEDGGAVSAKGTLESRLNLEIALRVEDLSALLGIKPYMIRTEDVSVYTGECTTIAQKKVSDLKNRVKTVNSIPNALLLSIHQNHFAEPKYYGTQVFYGKEDSSRTLAKTMQEDFKTYLNTNNHRMSKPAQSVYLMEHVTCTAILVECGFLSNLAEEQLLQEETYQKKLAMTMLRVIASEGKAVRNSEI